jgi:hypothetical protein
LALFYWENNDACSVHPEESFMVRIGITDFARRQTPSSKYNHFDGTWEELTALVTDWWNTRRASPHNSSVMRVPVPAEQLARFHTSIVAVTESTPLRAEFAPRVSGEAPFIQISAPGFPKAPAKHAEIILYSHEILEKDGDAPPTREADFYIVSINAYAGTDDEPMHPMTMARNFLGLKGGTRPEIPYTAEEFAQAIIYWSRHARIGH